LLLRQPSVQNLFNDYYYDSTSDPSYYSTLDKDGTEIYLEIVTQQLT